jgi:hypothetical protein
VLSYKSYFLDYPYYDPSAIGYRDIHVTRSPFITKEGLNAFRRVLTNMVRTVEFNPATWAAAITYSYSGTNAMATSTSAAAASLPLTFFDYGVLTGSWTEISWDYFAGSTNLHLGPDTNNYTVSALSAYWRDVSFTPMSIASNYYASGQVSRVRFYVATEASTPRYWYPQIWPYTQSEYLSLTNLHTYVGASLAANQSETYGYPVTHGAIPDISLPESAGDDPRSWLLRDNGGYFSTNQVWTLVGDVTNPPAPPTFTLDASSHAKTDLLAPVQSLHASGTEYRFIDGPANDWDVYTFRDLTASWRYHSMRISKTMMIVDWSITLKSSGGYTNSP